MRPPDRGLCLECGRSGAIVGQSLDPQHPLVRCAWTDQDGPHGHGVRIGTLIQAESDAIQIRKRERRQELAHNRGSHVKGRWPYCPVCRAAKAADAAASQGPSAAAKSAPARQAQEVTE